MGTILGLLCFILSKLYFDDKTLLGFWFGCGFIVLGLLSIISSGS